MRVNRVSHLFSLLGHSPVQLINVEQVGDHFLRKKVLSHQLALYVKRDDLLHPILSGNKWRKLKYLLLDIEAKGYRSIASMGGRYSNFLHSLSYACMLLGWKTKVFVRGYPEQTSTPMLEDIKRWGTNIVYLDKQSFKQIRDMRPDLNKDTFWLPEGGYNYLAVKGIAETFAELSKTYDSLVVASATGTSLAGYASAVSTLSLKTQVIGIPVLYNALQIKRNIESLQLSLTMPHLIEGYEFGGYAKTNQQLSDFMRLFSKISTVPIEPIYSGKSFFAVMDLIKQNYFKKGSRILLIHCGGLQGSRTFSPTL